MIIVVALLLGALLVSGRYGSNPRIPGFNPTPTHPPLVATPTPQPTWTKGAPSTPLPTAGIAATMTRGKDGMALVYIPAGEFPMGSSDEQIDGLLKRFGDYKRSSFSDEQPQRMVYLDAFRIDRTEVTNLMYSQCVAMGACKKPHDTKSYTRKSYYDNPDFANYPVIEVDWTMATAYCAWVGRKLPTEAEYEKAARGTDGRFFPWGNEIECSKANYHGAQGGKDCVGDTTPVGSYPSGASFYGALDMAGNVWEWVSDWYAPYDPSQNRNPQGPSSGNERVLRGGSWGDQMRYLLTTARFKISPTYTGNIIGFRCATSP